MSLIESDGILVAWATIDPSAGSKGIRAFVVEANTPGVKITKLEKKLGMVHAQHLVLRGTQSQRHRCGGF